MTTERGGRPKVEFDLEEVENLAALGCTQAEIAAFFGCSRQTVERRAHDDQEFRDALDRGMTAAKLSLRRRMIAIAESERNDAGKMAIWLSKQWLAMRDKVDTNSTIELKQDPATVRATIVERLRMLHANRESPQDEGSPSDSSSEASASPAPEP